MTTAQAMPAGTLRRIGSFPPPARAGRWSMRTVAEIIGVTVIVVSLWIANLASVKYAAMRRDNDERLWRQIERAEDAVKTFNQNPANAVTTLLVAADEIEMHAPFNREAIRRWREAHDNAVKAAREREP